VVQKPGLLLTLGMSVGLALERVENSGICPRRCLPSSRIPVSKVAAWLNFAGIYQYTAPAKPSAFFRAVSASAELISVASELLAGSIRPLVQGAFRLG
jgi:hypothetical protein